MITEDYVSFETAKLLKEKGFKELTYACFTNGGDDIYGYRAVGDDIMRPTLQMAMKWLREKYHYYIQVMLDSWTCGGHSGYYVVIQKTDSDFDMMLQDAVDEVFYQTYEEACEEAIRYCLENNLVMSKAEQRAFEAYPYVGEIKGDICDNPRPVFIKGYEEANKDIISLIESRIAEILGDAQPAPILRMELQELIDKIKEGTK